MSTNYPTSVDSFTNPSAADKLNAPPHATQHADENDSIVAIQNRIGTGSQTTPGAANYVFRSTSATASEWGPVNLATDTAGSLSLVAQSGLLPLGTGTSGSLAIQSVSSLSTFVGWSTWTPTWDTNGAGTLSATSVSFARYMRLANVVWINIAASHTISSSDAATTAIRFTLPVNTTATAHLFFAYVKDPSDDTVQNPSFATHVHSGAANKCAVYRTHAGNTVSMIEQWSNGTLRSIWVQGFYEVA